jgi:hypothetical protein
MNKSRLLIASLIALAALSAGNRAVADEITYFGDFEDVSGSGPSYSSSDTPEPDSSLFLFVESIVGIPKFDPALGSLTDITVFVEDTAPITYDISGDLTATNIGPADPGGFGFIVDVRFDGDIGIHYEDPSGATLTPVFLDDLVFISSCAGSSETSSCSADADHFEDGILEGSESVFGFVDPVDFVGPGDVDSLFLIAFLSATAEFPTLINAEAEVTTSFDVSGSPVVGVSIVGVTYTFDPIPEPTTLFLVAQALAVLAGVRKRR